MNADDFSVINWVTSFIKDCPTKNQDLDYYSTALERGDVGSYLSYLPITQKSHPDYPYVYLAQNALAKAVFPKGMYSAAKARQTAIQRFYLAEGMCCETNLRLSKIDKERQFQLKYYREIHILDRAKEIIVDVLGNLNYSSLLRAARFTDGTDSANPFGFTSSYHKYSSNPESTRSARDIAWIFINATPRWAARIAGTNQRINQYNDYSFRPVSVLPCVVKTVEGNRVEFVPKNAKTDRAIAVEPHLNVYIQRAIGVSIRNKLLKKGIDLINGQDLNRDLARIGSVRGCVATIDLSMASDTVSRKLVEYLLPASWHLLMNKVRSSHGSINGKLIEYEKFSSMGNGYTFELESLIFYALIRASIPPDKWAQCREFVHVYGDDLIVPTEYVNQVLNILEFSGFSPNTDKTFIDGPFRESCGKDYLNGSNIRPFFIKETGRFNRRAFFKLANAIRLYAGYDFHSQSHRHWLHSHWRGIVSRISRPLPIPVTYGPDQGLYVTEREFFEYGGKLTPCGSSWGITALAAIPDERALAQLYRDKGRGSPKRGDYHLLLMIALRDNDSNPQDIARNSYTNDTPVSPSDITLNFSKGNPVRYIEVSTSSGVFSSPAEW